ncbi:MAG TPA: hypothetical protein VKR05_06830 [Candidatus Cybelea sp.]|nr:hypothetical protein [Candidatus Cybelea sp.]
MHQLVIQFPLRNTKPDVAELDALVALEGTLDQDANGAYEVDGHDAGAGEMHIFILTDDAISTFNMIKGKLPDEPSWRAGFRDLDSDDYTPLAPAGLTNFEVQ